MKITSAYLHTTLHTGEAIGHPIYYACVAAFGHGPYAIAAGVMAVITLLLLIIVEG